jgi:ParB-like chromosome segregation protein Spo0J
MTAPPRNRIKAHRRVRAGELVPHELNPRTHSPAQRQALAALYEEIGFARSLLAYELPDGRLKLIDGHLRQAMHPDLEVDVEVLDVSDAEARALLLSIDPVAQLAGYDHEVLDALRAVTQTDSEVLDQFWQAIARQDEAVRSDLAQADSGEPDESIRERYLVLIECTSETNQVQLLQRFREEGLNCRALLS